MTLEQVLEEWATDSKLPRNNLDEASRQTPSLHSKYLTLLSHAKLKMKKAEMDQKSLLKDKWLYYNGKMDEERIKELGWSDDPFDGLKIMKNDMQIFFNADADLQKLNAQTEYAQITIDFLKRCMENITWRHQTIKNTIDWRKFMAGS